MPNILRCDNQAAIVLHGPDGTLYADLNDTEPCRVIKTGPSTRGGPMLPKHPHSWDRTKYRHHRWCRWCGLLEEI